MKSNSTPEGQGRPLSGLLAVAMLALLSAMTATELSALPDDRNQPIQIQAGSADRDAKTGITTYSGNVEIHQGSIRIAADTVVLHSENDELTSMVATGKPATYSQQLSEEDGKVDAQAGQIHYDVPKDLLVLEGNGSLKQNGGSISGEHIEYDVKAENVRARAAENGSSDNSKRITVVIPPNKKIQTSAPESAAQ